jgi:ubiquitin-conjugating enzyme E2 C
MAMASHRNPPDVVPGTTTPSSSGAITPVAAAAPSSPPQQQIANAAVATQRLQKELIDLMMGPGQLPGVSAFPANDDLFHWAATMIGPPGTLYDGLEFSLDLRFTSSYPYVAPIVRFRTGCYHPNVDPLSGDVCLDVLQDRWTAVMSASSVLLSLQALLAAPNLESPLNVNAAQRWSDQDYVKQQILRLASSTRPLTV